MIMSAQPNTGETHSMAQEASKVPTKRTRNSKQQSRQASPQAVTAPFTLSRDTTHRLHVWTERPFPEEKIARLREEETDPNDVATAEVLSARLSIDGTGRGLSVSRAYRRQGIVRTGANEDVSIMLNMESWPQFVAMIGALDEQLKELVQKNS
ncbi:hypothetical protein [Gemmatimonas sp.]|uniref:hypothetical protein n=1 Tax=Gemmatimonas sp. TaxID=1962908 RepID=UPI002EDB2B84